MRTPSITDDVISLLQEGKERIAAGWCRNVFRQLTPEGRLEVCARGAVGRDIHVWGNTTVDGAELALAETVACANHGDDLVGLAWPQHLIAPTIVANHNNACLRDQVDALDWFDRAIHWAKEHRS